MKKDATTKGTPVESRRDFLKHSAMVAGGVAVSGIVAGKPAMAAQDVKDIRWDETFDVIVVGSGFAGSAAAVEAGEAGARTLMIEKMMTLGGNSAINGGCMAVIDSPLQQAKGVKDSADRLYQDMLTAGRGLSDEKLVRIAADGNHDAYKFVTEKGTKFSDRLEFYGGHSVARVIITPNDAGADITRPLQAHARKLGVVIRPKTKLDEIIRDDSGRVVGIKIRQNFRFNFKKRDNELNNTSGTVKYIRATKGVIMATGGFGSDWRFRATQDPRLDINFDSTNQPGATAGALEAMLAVGAIPSLLSRIQLGPWCSPDEKGYGLVPNFATPVLQYGISVDVRTGKRYMNELADRRTRAQAILGQKDEKGIPCYPITFADSRVAGKTGVETLQKPLRKGVVKQFDSLEDLAAHYGVPVAGLKKTVQEYNASVKKGEDAAFGKPMKAVDGIDISKPPFYSYRLSTKIHHCMGGVKINEKAQVLDMNTYEPIPGLYAAGEAVAGVHGASRLGACAIPDCLVFGRIAGKHAASRG